MNTLENVFHQNKCQKIISVFSECFPKKKHWKKIKKILQSKSIIIDWALAASEDLKALKSLPGL